MIAVLGCLIALLGVALAAKWAAKARTAACMSRMTTIYKLVRNYASNWDGWTNPDPDYYVELAGYPLSYEPGYDPQKAGRVRDFVCPSDGQPKKNGHGYPASYRIVGPAAGGNVLVCGGSEEGSRTLAAYEAAKRHRDPRSGRLDAVYVYLDGRAWIGISESYLPQGLAVRAWRTGSDSWEAIKRGTFGQKQDYDGVWFWPSCVDPDKWMRLALSLADSKSGSAPAQSQSDEVIWRWDGLVRLGEGERPIRAQGGNWVFLWIDVNRDGIVQDDETAETKEGDPGVKFGRTWSTTIGGKDLPYHRRYRHQCTFMFLRSDGDCVFKFFWTRPGGSEEPIPQEALTYRPELD